MPGPSILFLADPHLGRDMPGHQASFEEVLRRAALKEPSLVVVLGDVTQDGKVKPEYFPYARDQIARFGVPVMCIPGNHEEGYNAHRTTWDPRVQHEFLGRFEQFFNPVPWARTVDTFRVLGIDSQILGSGFGEETEQLTWLRHQLDRTHEDGRFSVVVMHTPLYVATPDASDDPHDYWAVPPEARSKEFPSSH